jgi:N-acyl-L-homoserine lactone synthetase
MDEARAPATTGSASGRQEVHERGMIDLVLPEARFAFASALMQMHHDRKRVFVDRLNWALPSPQSWLEVDDFDNEHAVYLLARSPASGRHEGSVRLLPSTGRHMLGSIFSELCAGPVPVGPDCWEISRFVTAPPAVAGTSVMRLHRMLACGIAEFALLNSIERYTLVTEPRRLPALLSVGWTVQPLGLPTLCLGQELQALQILIDEKSLGELRAKLGIGGPLLQFERLQCEAA